MMKKVLFFTLFLPVAASSFSQNIPNRFLFLEGSASRGEHRDFFMSNFAMEAESSGYIITRTKEEAAHTFKFNVGPNPNPREDGNQYVIKVSLVNNEDNSEILSLDLFFNTLDETYPFNRTLFQNATVFIPPFSEGETADGRWRNKWLYLRTSFDYPITFYKLLPEGLHGKRALYAGSISSPTDIWALDHIVTAMPGATLGLEFQPLNFLSLEVNIQASWGNTRDNNFINLAVGAELKFPINFGNIVFSPYAAFIYIPKLLETDVIQETLGVQGFGISDIFKDFPPFWIGAGVQVSTRGGRNGAFFLDIKYVFLSFDSSFSTTDTIMSNPWKSINNRYPNPDVIHYQRSFIGIGIGYKFGFIDRKR